MEIQVSYHASVYNRRPWKVTVGSRPGVFDETIAECDHPLPAILAAFEAQKVWHLPVRIPQRIVERFVLPYTIRRVEVT